jgi:hypothetical protein
MVSFDDVGCLKEFGASKFGNEPGTYQISGVLLGNYQISGVLLVSCANYSNQ